MVRMVRMERRARATGGRDRRLQHLGLALVFAGLGLAGCSGGLSVERVGPKPGPDQKLVLLLHGYGAAGDDLVGLAKDLSGELPSVTFLMPAAPHRVGVSGRSWVPSFSAPSREEYAQRLVIEAADTRAKLWRLIDEARGSGVACSDIVVGGFSMGGRMAIEVATHAPPGCALGGLVVMSGGGMDELPLPETSATTVRALVTHGKSDSIVPRVKGIAAAKALLKLGSDVRWLSFDGGHQIPRPVREAVGAFLRGEAVGTTVP